MVGGHDVSLSRSRVESMRHNIALIHFVLISLQGSHSSTYRSTMTMSESIPNDVASGPRIAPSPFDRSITDIILRTTDNFDFHVFSQVLIAASPFFEEMLQLPHSSPPGQGQLNYGKPIIPISEDSTTLSILLRICYPVMQQDVKTLEELEPALRAAMEFEMELAIAVLTKRLEKLACKFPLKAWAIAWNLSRALRLRGCRSRNSRTTRSISCRE
ncbi:hypothetical protein C8Q80DRAFT_244295 [Daedaleopsis nitida]|nr:hypothetical protein C8Q80DRAFT_244295 [Daedaleopsis nitida]